jgi:hypothetical protein
MTERLQIPMMICCLIVATIAIYNFSLMAPYSALSSLHFDLWNIGSPYPEKSTPTTWARGHQLAKAATRGEQLTRIDARGFQNGSSSIVD